MSELVERKSYSKNDDKDRRLVVEAANRGNDWRALAASLGVKYKTAYTWVRSGEIASKPRGGQKPKKIDEEERKTTIGWVKENPSITLKRLQDKVPTNFNKAISTTTAANVLEGSLYIVKLTHAQPVTMNSEVNNKKAPFEIQFTLSEIQFAFSEIQLTLSEIQVTILKFNSRFLKYNLRFLKYNLHF